LGENLGYSAWITMRNTCYQSVDSTHNNANAALMGDPTLRMHPVAPASNLVVAGTSLSWTASAEAVSGYCVYRQDQGSGVYTKIKTTAGNETTYEDIAAISGVNYYMVRALKLETSNSGSYFNLSQGMFGSTDKTAPSRPVNIHCTNISNTSATINWAASTDNGTLEGYEIYCDGKSVGITSLLSFTILKLYPSTQYAITLIARDISGNNSIISNPLLVNTTADTLSPSTPIGLKHSRPVGSVFTIYWKPSTDNIGVTGYEIYNDGEFLGTTKDTTYSGEGLASVNYVFTVLAFDSAGNKSGVGIPLHITIGLYAYEGFNGSVNSGTGWNGNWNKKPGVTTAGLAFGALKVVGDKLGGPVINNMSRPINLGITDGDSLFISYLCNENAADVNLILTSAAGGIALRNGRFQSDIVGAVQENSYSAYNIAGTEGDFITPASVAGTTSFNLVVIKRTGTGFQLRRWIYTNPADLPYSMPVLGDAKAFTSGQYTSNDLRYLDITGINLLCKNGTLPVYYDEIRIGHSFTDVVPATTFSLIEKPKLEGIIIYAVSDNIVADLTGLRGAAVISVIDLKGSVIKTVKSTGNEKLTISIQNKGIYLVRVWNGGKSYSQKVILF